MAKTPNLADQLFHELQRQILSGELAPGRRLPPERELAALYDTNRNTLREAIRKLEQLRLVSVRHGQGVTVRDFRRDGTIEALEPFLLHGVDADEKVQCIADLLASRTKVLEYAMSFAIERATDEDVEKLGELTTVLLAAFETRDRVALSKGYHHWLECVVDAAHSLPARWIANPFLEMTKHLIERIPAIWVTDEGFADYLRNAYAAIVDRDLATAAAVNRTYYDRVDERILLTVNSLVDSGIDFGSVIDETGAHEAVRLTAERRADKARRDEEAQKNNDTGGSPNVH